MRAGSTTFPLTTSSREAKSRALANLGETVFGDAKFDKLKTNLGNIATQWMFEKPLIFKSSVDEAYGQKATFSPGFGCTISDAVQASCSAYPFFARKTITKDNGDRVEAMDGGYCPTTRRSTVLLMQSSPLTNRPMSYAFLALV